MVYVIDIDSLIPLNVRNPKLRQGCFYLRAGGKLISKAFLLAHGHSRILKLINSVSPCLHIVLAP